MSETMRTIRDWREARGWTQRELAERAGVDTQQVYQWETNRRGITARHLRAIAQALEVSMDDIALPGEETADA